MIRKLWGTVAVLLLIAMTVAGCGGTAAKPTTPAPAAAEPAKNEPAKASPKQTVYPITMKDGAGRDVTITAEPKRIVSVAPSNTEMLFALGKGSVLVGRSDFCDYPADAAKVPSVGGFHPPNYELIVAAKPDLLLMTGGSVEARDKLVNEYKINVFVLDPQNFDQLYAGLKLLGTAVNAQESADKVVADMQQQVKAISEKAATAKSKPKVFYEVWHDPIMTAGNNTFINDLIKLAGGENVGAAVEGWANFSLEQLAAANPDYLVTGSVDSAATVKDRKGWEGIKAVKESKVVGLADQNIIVRPGPRLVLGLKFFAETIHPDLFK